MPKFEGFKAYKRAGSAKAAIKKQGLAGMAHRIERRGEKYFPLFCVASGEDQIELARRGFDAFIDKSKAAQ